MPDFDSSYDARRDSDYQPYRLPNGFPIYLGMLLVVIHVAMLVVWMFVFTANRGTEGVLLFGLSSPALRHGAFWQPFTHVLTHPPGTAWDTLNFALEMYLLWIFGREVERFFGRTLFLKLYLLLCLVPTIIVLAFGWMWPSLYFGSFCADFGVFFAFATLYPRAQMMFALTAWSLALILAAVVMIPDVAHRSWTHLLIFVASCVTAHVFVRYQRGEFTLPSFRSLIPRRKPKFHVVPRPAPPVQKVKLISQADSMEDVDALLDKIARSGLNSLSAAERARLERASADLKKRPEPH